MTTCNNENTKKAYRRDRPFTAIGTGKIESLITRLSNIENNSNLKTLSAVDWILDDNDDDDYRIPIISKQKVRPLASSNNYNIQSNNRTRPLTGVKHTAVIYDNTARPLTSHNKNNYDTKNSIASKEDELSSLLIDEILIAKENDANELPKHLQQFKHDLMHATNNTKLQLPILGILSPGHKKQASYLPPPNDIETMKLREYEKKVQNVDLSQLYQSLSRDVDTNNYYNDDNGSTDHNHHHNVHHRNKVDTVDPYSQRYYNSTERYFKRQEDRKNKETDYLSKYSNQYETDANNYYNQKIVINRMKRSQTAKRIVAPNPILSPIRNISTAPARTPNSSILLKLPQHPAQGTFADLFFQNETTNHSNEKQNDPLNQSSILTFKSSTENNSLSSAALPEAYISYENMKTKYQLFLDQRKDLKKQSESLNQIFDSAYDDLGIDLNPLYNKKRYFGKAFMLLLYYYNYFRQKQGILHWYEQAKKVTACRELNAGILLVRVGRGMLGRVKCKIIRDNLKRQAEAKAEYQRQMELYYNTNASIITRSIVTYVKSKIIMRRHLKHRRKATVIQKIARGYIVRCRFAFAFETKMKQRISAIKIQCAYRQRLAMRRVLLFWKIRNVAFKNTEISNNLDMKRSFLQRHGGAYVIQRYYTAYKIRKRLKSILFWYHEAVITATQARFRGYKVRKWYVKTLRLRKLKYAKQNNASTQIQRIFRGYSKRKIFKGLVNEKKQMLNEKKLMKKEKMKSNYVTLNFLDKDYKVNPFKLIRTILRKIMPLRYMYEEPKAIIIQTAWRKYYAKKRVFRLKVCKSIADMMNRNHMKLKGAVMFQALYKGYRFRNDQMRKNRIKMCIRIQCAVRYKQANRRVYSIRARAEATIMIRRNLIIVLHARKLQKMRTIRKIYDKKSRVIQRLIRSFLGKKYFHYLKSSIRSEEEFIAMARFNIDCLIAMVQLKILRESFLRDIGTRIRNTCNEDCIGLGPVQAVFLSALGERAMYGEKDLITNKADLQILTKFVNRLNDAALTVKKDKLNSRKHQPLLLKLLEKRSIELPVVVVKKLSPIDVSVAMSSAKTESGNALSYFEFVNWIYRIGNVYFKEVKRNRRNLLLGATVTQSALKISKNSPSDGEPIVDPKDVNSVDVTENENVVQQRNTYNIRKSLIVSLEEFKEDLGLTCIIRILSLLSLHVDFTNIPKVMRWLDDESMARLGVFVIRIQSMYRLWKGRRLMEQMRAIREQVRASIVFHKAGTKINSWIRRFLRTRKVAKAAQNIYIHFFPLNVKDYWYNPRTTRTFQSKPSILLKYECLPVPVPETGFECIVACLLCSQKAQVNCSGCEESFCFNHFKDSHSKGAKTNHHFTYIPSCSNCKFQNATKNCLTCIIERPKPTDVNVERDVPKADKGLYCDSCFTHTHDQLQQVNDANHPVAKFREYSLLKSTREGYLKQTNLRRKILCEHRYDSLVEPCEECKVGSASWRCRDCNQLYCHVCLSQIHTSGVFKKHKAERLPYFTVEMAKNYRQQEAIFRTQTKFNKLKKEEARRRETFVKESILRIQTWYRKYYWGRKGRRYMKALRTRMQRDYRYRKKETLKKRSTLMYKILDFFSRAPILFSDTKEERVMKRVNILWRQRVKEIIWQNRSDWGFYMHLKPCKGVPKKGFAIGTIEELIDQAKNGGYRMPGVVMMKRTQKIHQTTTSLVDILEPGQIIRVREFLIRVVKITDDGLEFASRWRYKSSPTDGEVFYRMPCDDNENGFYYKMKFYYQQFKESNFATNAYWFSYAKLLGAAEMFCAKLAVPDEKDGPRDKEQLAWLKKSKYYKRKREWAESYIISDDGISKPKKLENIDGLDDDLNDAMDGEDRLEQYIKDLLKILRSENRGGQSELEAQKTIMMLKGRKPDTEWFATSFETQREDARTSHMNRDELAEEAVDWETLYDAFAGVNYYVNIKTKQRMGTEPKQITAKKEKQAYMESRRQEYEDNKLAITKSKQLAASSAKTLGGKKMLKR